jgi:uncharacterized protein (DUF433 family)
MNEYIQIDHSICGGKPVICGTRIMIRNILGMVAGGYTVDKILEAYPELTADVIRGVLQYAAKEVPNERICHD